MERKTNIDFDRLKYSLTGEYEEVMLEKQLKEKDKEIERLNNIINDLLKRQNEALNYISNFLSMDNRYKHGNENDELCENKMRGNNR